MLYSEASKYVQMRLRYRAHCMICNEKIEQDQPFEYIAVKMGKCKYYNFFHTSCLTKNRVRMADAELTSRHGEG